MKTQRFNYLYSCILLGVLVVGMLTSCGKKETDASVYVKGLSDMAAQYNKNCPKDQPNGTVLESVTFADSTMTFRLSLSDKAIETVNLEDARDSIIHNMSDNLKKFLVKGNCNIEYKYVSPNDSSSITIIPNELGYTESEEK